MSVMVSKRRTDSFHDKVESCVVMTEKRKEPISVVGWPAFLKRDSNPYNNLLYAAISELGVKVQDFSLAGWRAVDSDVIHVHWPENTVEHAATLRAARWTLTLLWALAALRRRGVRVVWTAHNMEQHERRHPALARLYWNVFPRLVDGIICLSEGTIEPLTRRLRRRKVPITVIPHGHYRGAYPDTISPAEARSSLGLEQDALVIGWVGAIRAYKNVDGLVTAFCDTARQHWRLVLAGNVKEESLHERLQDRAQRDTRVKYHPGWIPAEEMQRYVKASSAIILPYHTIWNSGAALLALSFNRPVVLPRSASMLELQEQVGDRWVYLYDGAFTGDTLRDCIDWSQNAGRSAGPDLSGLSWDSIAARTVAFYEQVLSSRNE